jgi:hypothetical protein
MKINVINTGGSEKIIKYTLHFLPIEIHLKKEFVYYEKTIEWEGFTKTSASKKYISHFYYRWDDLEGYKRLVTAASNILGLETEPEVVTIKKSEIKRYKKNNNECIEWLGEASFQRIYGIRTPLKYLYRMWDRWELFKKMNENEYGDLINQEIKEEIFKDSDFLEIYRNIFNYLFQQGVVVHKAYYEPTIKQLEILTKKLKNYENKH